MSQRNVEQVVGRLVTDEGFRRRFAADPGAELRRLVEAGVALNPCELRALSALDLRRLESFADAIHPCIQKVELPKIERPKIERPGLDVENGSLRSTNSSEDDRDRDPAAEHLGEPQ